MLCDKCSNIHFRTFAECKTLHHSLPPAWIKCDPESSLVFYAHHDGPDELRQSSNDGCHFCVMLQHRFLSNYHKQVSEKFASPTSQVFMFMFTKAIPSWETVPDWRQLSRLFIQCGDQMITAAGLGYERIDGSLVEEMLHFLTAPKTCSSHEAASKHSQHKLENLRSEIPLSAELGSGVIKIENSDAFSPQKDNSTTSHANLALAAHWLDSCRRKHKVCKDFETIGQLPYRIIDIQNPETPVLAFGAGRNEPYVALSYKWGDIVETLPRTFKDAVFVANSLGYRWLWIDALCICHDNSTEQSQQISSMDAIFQAAELVIFASSAASAESGLSSVRDPRLTKPCRLTIKTTLDGCLTQDSGYVTTFGGDMESDILHSRGWVLQEQVLAHRALMFDDRHMHWRCLCGKASESSPASTARTYESVQDIRMDTGLAIYPGQHHDYNRLRLYLRHAYTISDPHLGHLGRGTNHYEEWYNLIEDYNARQLTYEADVLSALGGLEKAMSKMYACTYYAGLWKEDLRSGLLWYVQKELPTIAKDPLPVLPSWSWIARRHCWIRFLRLDPRYQFQDDESFTVYQPAAEEEFNHTYSLSTIRPGCLTLKGILREVEVMPKILTDDFKDPFFHPSWSSMVRDSKKDKIIGQIWLDNDPKKTRIWHSRRLYCLRVGIQSRKELPHYSIEDDDRRQREIVCLALVPTDDTFEEFKRVGLIMLDTISVELPGTSDATEEHEQMRRTIRIV